MLLGLILARHTGLNIDERSVAQRTITLRIPQERAVWRNWSLSGIGTKTAGREEQQTEALRRWDENRHRRKITFEAVPAVTGFDHEFLEKG